MFIRRFGHLSCGFGFAALAACQHAAVAPANAAAERKPSVSVVPAAPPLSAESEITPAATAADASPFIESVRLGYAARLNIAGQGAYLSTEKLLLELRDDEVRIQPALLEGLQHGRSQFPRVVGSMPESGWVVQTRYEERTSRSTLSRWAGAEWQNADALLQNKNLIGIAPWSSGRTLLPKKFFRRQTFPESPQKCAA